MDFLEIPEGLSAGVVIEWIPRLSQPVGYLKFYDPDGEVMLCQKITNGYPANLLDFLALAQNIADEESLAVDCPKILDPEQDPQMPVRLVFISPCRAAL